MIWYRSSTHDANKYGHLALSLLFRTGQRALTYPNSFWVRRTQNWVRQAQNLGTPYQKHLEIFREKFFFLEIQSNRQF